MSDDLMTGYSEDGVAAEIPDSFEHGLREAVRQSGEAGSSTPAPETPADPALSTGQEIVQGLLGDSSDPTKFDVQVPDAPASPAPSEVRLGDGEVYGAREIDAAVEEAVANQEELQAYRDSEASQTWDSDLDEVFTDEDLYGALGEQALRYANGELSAEQYAEFRAEALSELAPAYLEEDASGQYDPAQLNHVAAMLDQGVQQYAAARHLEDIDQAMPELVERAAQDRVGQMRASLVKLAADQDISAAAERLGVEPTELLDWRLKQAEAQFRGATGLELGDLWADPSVPPEVAHELLAQADAQVGATLKLARDHDFKERLLGAGAGALSEGLTIEGRPVVQEHLPLPSAEKIARTDAAFRARKRIQHPGSIKASFADERSLQNGWTDKNGRPITRLSTIDGSAAQWERDEQARREQAKL
jgi:hypothetical protein